MRTPVSLLLTLPLLLTAGGGVATAATPTFSSSLNHHAIILAADPAGITVDKPWARPSIGTAGMSAAYFTITDGGPADRLVGVSTPIAGSADIHESLEENGVMKMRGVAGVALEPGKPVTFRPGGYHVMLMGLKQPLKAGDSFPLTLRFEHAAPLTVNVTVHTGTGPAASQGFDMHMGQAAPADHTTGTHN